MFELTTPSPPYLKPQVLPFTNHANNLPLLAFTGYEERPLLLLHFLSYYFTHLDAAPELEEVAKPTCLWGSTVIPR